MISIEIARIMKAKEDIADAIRDKNVEVDENLTIDKYSELIAKIEQGGSESWHCDNPCCFTLAPTVSFSDITNQRLIGGEYSFDKTTWYPMTDTIRLSRPTAVAPNAHEFVYIRSKSVGGLNGNFNSSAFKITYGVILSGDASSLIEATSGVAYNSCFVNLFYNVSTIDINNFKLPSGVAPYCYYQMFYGCSNLTSTPELPSPTLSDYCYDSMFYNCTKITTSPELPATTLGLGCYRNMFFNCISLTTAPELPATTLTSSCYYRMFYKCTSLTTAPELPATTLASSCYYQMFINCSNLTSIKTHASTWNTSSANNWVSGVAATGEFHKKSGVEIPTGTSGIPSGWTVIEDLE